MVTPPSDLRRAASGRPVSVLPTYAPVMQRRLCPVRPTSRWLTSVGLAVACAATFLCAMPRQAVALVFTGTIGTDTTWTRDMVKSCVWASGGFLGWRDFLGDLGSVLEDDSSHDIG